MSAPCLHGSSCHPVPLAVPFLQSSQPHPFSTLKRSRRSAFLGSMDSVWKSGNAVGDSGNYFKEFRHQIGGSENSYGDSGNSFGGSHQYFRSDHLKWNPTGASNWSPVIGRSRRSAEGAAQDQQTHVTSHAGEDDSGSWNSSSSSVPGLSPYSWEMSVDGDIGYKCVCGPWSSGRYCEWTAPRPKVHNSISPLLLLGLLIGLALFCEYQIFCDARLGQLAINIVPLST